MVEFSIRMEAFTTLDISDFSFFRCFLNELVDLFGEKRMSILDVLSPKEAYSDKAIPLSSCSNKKLETIYSEGGAVLHDNDGQFFTQLNWIKHKGPDARRFVRAMGYKQNNIYFGANETSMSQNSFQMKILTLCDRVTEIFSVNYLCTYDLEYDKQGYGTKLELGAGLKNIYWLNIFGLPYIEILGREKLLSSPAYEVNGLGANHIRLLATPTYNSFKGKRRNELRAHIRDHFGEAYFTKKKSACHEGPNAGGLFTLLRIMRRSHKEFNDTSWYADIRPEFDYSQILKI